MSEPELTSQSLPAGTNWAALHARLAIAIEGLQRGFEPDVAEIDRRLRDRARRLSRVGVVDDRNSGDFQLLRFTAGGIALGVDAAAAQEVRAEQMVTPVPCVTSHIAGIAHLRGQILTIVDFANLGGQAPATLDGPVTLLILTRGDRTLGLIIDRVQAVTPAWRDRLSPVPATIQGHRRFYLGVADDGTLVLDSAMLFDDGGIFATLGVTGTGTGE